MVTETREYIPTPTELAQWRWWCEHLDSKRGKSSYGWGGPITKRDKRRRPDGLIFYSTGWGWRLRKGWRERLAELEKAARVDAP